MSAVEAEKRAVSEVAAALVADGMVVGLGTGSTVAYLLSAVAERGPAARYVATSPRTERAARELGLPLEPFDSVDRLDLTIDGADQVDPSGWLVKGGGAAHTREKVVASASDRFVVIVSSDKLVEAIAPPIPLELLAFGIPATLRRLGLGELRDAPPSPDGGVIADYIGPVEDPGELSDRLSAIPGVIEHGLFPPSLVSEILVGRNGSVERIEL